MDHASRCPEVARMSVMMDILRDLTQLDRVMCAPGYDHALEYLQRFLPLTVHAYRAEDVYNGWLIPPSWEVEEATISRDGRVVYDGTWHPLAVIALSAPFSGRVELDELKRHLHFDHRYPDSLTYHFRQQYRTWSRDWGFCVPAELYDALEPGEYDVLLRTREAPGVLKVAVGHHAGSQPHTVALCANLDHPGVANDGLSGVAVGVEVLRRLQDHATRLSYSLVLAPGIIGSEYYLGRSTPEDRGCLLECVCLWMLGSRTGLALQESRGGLSNIEHALASVMAERGVPFRRGGFQEIIINDEYLWEAYDIPTCSLSRFPYPEYHSSRDDVSIMSEDCLEEAVEVVMKAIALLEATPLLETHFQGTVCLSNPRYDLYVDPGQVAFGEQVEDGQRRLRQLQDFLPTVRRPVSVRALADRFGLSQEAVLDYLRKWERAGLIGLGAEAPRETMEST
jgi:aminopeptidase-like protein